MTPAARALELFLARPTGVNKIDWLANELLALAAESASLSLRLVRDETGTDLRFEAADPSETIASRSPTPLRLFRTVLARLAKMAQEENDAEFNPYGGRYYFNRNGPKGPVRIDVELENTAGLQRLTLRRAVCPSTVGQTGQEDAPDWLPPELRGEQAI
jgi:hypothetical protein